ncbi:hypothetical protein AB0H18_10095 [Streptomyces sp. NPDC020766]|uniref:hypothetical protein n=1 Tax=Streptomyces sp. NPDC020766 TaxID=3155011 RepID=UPI0033F11FED
MLTAPAAAKVTEAAKAVKVTEAAKSPRTASRVRAARASRTVVAVPRLLPLAPGTRSLGTRGRRVTRQEELHTFAERRISRWTPL